jgi:trk system potassium uptake protein TrkH
MRFIYYIAPFDLRVIALNLAKALQLIGTILVLPSLAALVFGETPFVFLFLALAAGGWLAGLWLVKIFPNAPELELREALVVTALAYLIFALIGAVAFLPVAPFIDSFFEAMSGITTTGLSVLDVEALPMSLLFFRAYSQWLGGIGIVVLSLVVLIGPGKTAHQLYATEFSKENLLGSVIETARLVTKIYIVLTAIGFLAFIVAGMKPFDALLHIMSTLSTGGFSRFSQSIGTYQANIFIRIAVMFFMILGAINLTLYYFVRLGGINRLFKNIEVLVLTSLLIISTLFFWGFAGFSLQSLVDSMFNAITSLTTTGFNVDDPAGWNAQTKFLSACLMTIGGTTCSTAGGIKIFRLLIMLKLAIWLFKKMILPEETKLAIKFGDLPVADDEIKQIFGLLVLYFCLLIGSTIIFSGAGFAVVDAFFESASALGTVGLSSGITSVSLAAGLKGVLIFDMWAGRLEILPVLIALYPGTWFCRRKET